MAITKPDAKKQITNMPGVDSSGITLVSSQATTSGTAWDFTGIPSWVNRITVMFKGISTNGTSNILLQIGDGAINTSGYSAGAYLQTNLTSTSTAGFLLTTSLTAADALQGDVTLSRQSGNTWVSKGSLFYSSQTFTAVSAGGKTLSGNLDRVRLTTVNGTDSGDLGSVGISYE